nr:MAG TPA: hypothetical protein [Caudoviricetes sp.]
MQKNSHPRNYPRVAICVGFKRALASPTNQSTRTKFT